MDIVLNPLDEVFLTPYVYPEWLPANNPLRELLSLWIITTLGGALLIIIPCSINYFFFFDHNLMKHPRFLKNQVRQEILYAMWAVPYMTFLTAIMFVLELHGWGYLYTNVDDHPWGWWLIIFSVPSFLFFTDFGIYWIHRWLHHPLFYGPLHKAHHKWIICTPFASHAFHPIDGFAQSFPYHLYPFLFPLNKYLYLGLFMFVNLWTVSIHDGIYKVPDFLKPFINGSAHHTDHHADFHYNFGQYFTLWDRIGGSFKHPSGFQQGKSIYDQVERHLKDEAISDDPFYGIDPLEIERFAKENNIKVTEAEIEEYKKKRIADDENDTKKSK